MPREGPQVSQEDVQAAGTDRHGTYTPVGDFFAPFFTIEVASATKETITKVDETTGAESEEEFVDRKRSLVFRDFVASIEITVKSGTAEMRLSLQPPLDEALAMLERNDLRHGSIYLVEWGWTGQDGITSTSGKQIFTSTKPPTFEIQGTDVSISVEAISTLYYAANNRETIRTWKRWQHPRDIDILKEIAKKYSYDLDLTLTFTEATVNDELQARSEASVSRHALVHATYAERQRARANGVTPLYIPRPFFKDGPETLDQNLSDWVFFSSIIRDNNCDYYTKGNTIVIVDNNVVMRGPNVPYNLLFMIQPKTDRDIPIINLSTQVLPGTFPREAYEATQQHADHDTGEVVTEQHDPAEMRDLVSMGDRTFAGKAFFSGLNISVGGFSLVPFPSFEKRPSDGSTEPWETGKRYATPSAEPHRENKVAQTAREAAAYINQNMSVTIPGKPDLYPYTLVEVTGRLGNFAGVYVVTSVTHRLDSSGYECELALLRNSAVKTRAALERDKQQAESESDAQEPEGTKPKGPIADSGYRTPASGDEVSAEKANPDADLGDIQDAVREEGG